MKKLKLFILTCLCVVTGEFGKITGNWNPYLHMVNRDLHARLNGKTLYKKTKE